MGYLLCKFLYSVQYRKIQIIENSKVGHIYRCEEQLNSAYNRNMFGIIVLFLPVNVKIIKNYAGNYFKKYKNKIKPFMHNVVKWPDIL